MIFFVFSLSPALSRWEREPRGAHAPRVWIPAPRRNHPSATHGSSLGRGAQGGTRGRVRSPKNNHPFTHYAMPTLDTTTLYLSRWEREIGQASGVGMAVPSRPRLFRRAGDSTPHLPYDSFSLREKVAEGRMRVNGWLFFCETATI